jgi:hypothetical protein
MQFQTNSSESNGLDHLRPKWLSDAMSTLIRQVHLQGQRQASADVSV